MMCTVDINISCCDDCPFCVYNDLSDNCVLSDDELKFPYAFNSIPADCPLRNIEKIKYSNVKVRK